MTETRWVTLFEAAHRMEAEIAKEALEAQGFPAAIFQDSIMHTISLGGRIEVCVPSDRLEEAQAWLAEYEDDEVLELPDEESENEENSE